MYELLPHEKPEDTVIENDQELDKWWERFVQERTRSIAKSMGGKMSAARGSSGSVPIPEFTS